LNDKNIILLLKAIIISAACVAIGMILSLPSKMFITFLLIKRETEQKMNESDSETYSN